MITSCLLSLMIAISFSVIGCTERKDPEPQPEPEPEVSDVIPEGTVNFDETWLDE